MNPEKNDNVIQQRRIRIDVAYDGTAYAGWQVQPELVSVQQRLEETFAGVVGHSVKIHGSGRTDRGVHAKCQVAHLDVTTRIADISLQRAVNSRIAPDIRVTRLVTVAPDFHARRSAHGKEYRYFVWCGEIMPPEKRLYATHCHHLLDVPAMSKAAQWFVGTHDFAAFSANPQREIDTTVRTIFKFTVTGRGPQVTFAVQGNGFLYKQVRSMVGFLMRVGVGAERPDAVKELLDAANPRVARVPSAQPQGLFLWRVWYGGSRVRVHPGKNPREIDPRQRQHDKQQSDT